MHGEAAFQRQFVDMLPGITSKLVKTLQKPVHKHSKDIIAALNTWANFVTGLADSSLSFPFSHRQNTNLDYLYAKKKPLFTPILDCKKTT